MRLNPNFGGLLFLKKKSRNLRAKGPVETTSHLSSPSHPILQTLRWKPESLTLPTVLAPCVATAIIQMKMCYREVRKTGDDQP